MSASREQLSKLFNELSGEELRLLHLLRCLQDRDLIHEGGWLFPEDDNTVFSPPVVTNLGKALLDYVSSEGKSFS